MQRLGGRLTTDSPLRGSVTPAVVMRSTALIWDEGLWDEGFWDEGEELPIYAAAGVRVGPPLGGRIE